MRASADHLSSNQDSAAALWLVGALLVAIATGIATPFLLEGALELLAAVVAIIVVVGVLLMPRKLRFDDRKCWLLFLVALSLYAIYPTYISIQISGLPWISPLRVALAALLLSWLYALRTSRAMQTRILECYQQNKPFFYCLFVFVVSQFLSIPTSPNPGMALQKFLLFQLTWTLPFIVVLTLTTTSSRLHLLGVMIIVFGFIQCAIGFLEARQQRILWLDYLPPGFAAESEYLTRIVQGTFRADGYRVQGSFTVSLLYAEHLVLVLPFAMFAFIDGRSTILRTLGLVTAIAILPAQYLSGSRLGMVGSIVVFLAIGGFFVFRKWRENKRSMFGPFLMLMSPFALAGFAALYLNNARLKSLTLGGGAQQASTDTRLEMWRMGLPRIFDRPLFGHGPGLGAETLGFTNLAGVLTIDSYWLSALLEFGLIGAIALLGMVLWSIHAGFTAYQRPISPIHRLGGAIAVALLGFLVTKLVLSQIHNHLLIFILMGMMVSIRTDALAAASRNTPAVPSAPVHPRRRSWTGGLRPPIAHRPRPASTRAVSPTASGTRRLPTHAPTLARDL